MMPETPYFACSWCGWHGTLPEQRVCPECVYEYLEEFLSEEDYKRWVKEGREF